MRVPQVNERIKEAPAQVLRGVFAGIGQLLLVADKLRNKASAYQQVRPARVPEPVQTDRDADGESASPDEAPVSADAEAQPTVKLQQAWRTSEAQQAPEVPPTVKLLQAQEVQQAREAQQAQENRQAPEVRSAPERPKTPPTPRTPRTPRAEKASEIKEYDKTGNVRILGTGEGGEAPAISATPNRDAAPAEESAAAQAAPKAEEPAAQADGQAEEPAAQAAGQAEEPAAPLPNYEELSVASLRARLRNLDAPQVRQLIEYEKGHAGRADVIGMFERRIAKLEDGD